MHNPKKTKELIIYISYYLKDKSNYGSTLLNKALYLIDSMNYLKRGETITEFEYIKQDFGPTPEPSSFLSVRDEMVATNELLKVENDYFGRKQIKYIASREPNISVFDKEELFNITNTLDSIGDINATDISNYTHITIPWKFTIEKEKLPMFSFLLSHEEPSSKDFIWAKKEIKKYQKSK